jgi:predicted nucleic acid-binding protein
VILIDTSAWVDFFRNRGPLAGAVDVALERDEALLCGPVVTELRRGLVQASERAKVMRSLGGCQTLPQPRDLWEDAGDLGYLLGRKGVTVKTLDLLIAVFALAHDVPLMTRDNDFKLIRDSGVAPLRLA